MNKTFNLVWSQVSNSYVAVSEAVKSKGKGVSGSTLVASASATLMLLLGNSLAHAVAPAPTQLPTGAAVVGGSATVSQSGAVMQINQASSRAAINWQTFNVGSAATVNIAQPNASSVLLNRVLDTNASQIFGNINANGQVFLVNPNGVYFSPSASVNVGGFLATTASISTSDFMSGLTTFSNNGATGSIINNGNLTAMLGGYIALMAPSVINNGVIVAQMGTVALAAGSAYELQFAGNTLSNVRVTASTIDAFVSNGNAIYAPGGLIILSAQAAHDINSGIVGNIGNLDATGLTNNGGVIRLTASSTINAGGVIKADAAPNSVGNGGTVDIIADLTNPTSQTNVTGSITAKGGDLGGNGGLIDTSASHVNVADSAVVNTLAPKGDAGTWTIDPDGFTISATGDMTGAAVTSALGGGNFVILSTNGSGADGNVNVNDNITWNKNNLSITATNSINVNAVMAASNTASLTMVTGAPSPATPGVGLNYGLNSAGFFGETTFTQSGAGFLNINGKAYTIVNTLAQVQAINNALGNNYALGDSIDASATKTWNLDVPSGLYAGFIPIGSVASPLVGVFEGLGNTISNLYVTPVTSAAAVGFIGSVGTAPNLIENIGLIGGTIGRSFGGATPSSAQSGFLLGEGAAVVVRNSYATGNVIGGAHSGGLVGEMAIGAIYGSYATGAVTGGGDSFGGLLGFMSSGSIANSYATGNVDGGANTGGLVGQYSSGTVKNVYATGNVNGAANTGGLVGYYTSGTLGIAYATGNVTGAANVGGLVGAKTSGTVTSTYATGTVGGASGISGLIGGGDQTFITDSFSTGVVPGATILPSSYNTPYGSLSSNYYVPADGSTPYLIPLATTILVTPLNMTQVYNGLAFTGVDTSTYSAPVVNPVGTLVYTIPSLTDVGSSVISVSGYTNSQNYNFFYKTGTLSVTPATLTVTANDATKVYGAATPTLSNTITGFVNGQDASVVTGTATPTTTTTVASGVGSSVLVATPGNLASGNYVFTYANGTLTVTKAALTIKTDDSTAVYGSALPAFSNTVTGLVNGDTVSGTATYATTAVQGSNAGNYAVTTANLTASANYTVSFVAGNLTVTKATLTATAADAAKVYGDANPALTVGLTGFVNGDSALSASGLTASTANSTATALTSVGTSAITVTAGTANNYNITPVAGTLSVNPATLTVTANDATKVYGAATPALSNTITGFKNGQDASVVTGTATPTTTTTVASGVGSSVIVSTPGNLASGNYVFTYANGTLTVTKAALTIKTDDSTAVYGSALPAFSNTVTGLVNGDTVSGTATYATTAVQGSNAGNYAVTTANLTASANYTVSFVAGNLTITPAGITVLSINNTVVAGKTYDGNNSATLSGGQMIGVLGTDNVILVQSGTFNNVNVGTQSVTVADTLTGAQAGNYTITQPTGVTGVISAATLNVKANSTTKVYGTANPVLSNTITGFVNGETVAVVTGTATPTTTATRLSNVGSVAIIATSGNLASGNYVFTYTDGSLTIAPAALTVTVDNSSKVYGSGLPVFTGSMSGLVAGGTTPTASYSSTATSASNVGDYSINANLTADTNYSVSLVAGQLTVTKATLTATANDATKVFGAANPALSVSLVGFVNGDTASTTAGLTASRANSTATTSTPVGTSAITVAAGTANNYNITTVDGVLTITSSPVIVPVVIPEVQAEVPVSPFNNTVQRTTIRETMVITCLKGDTSGDLLPCSGSPSAPLTMPNIVVTKLEL